jgi:hypothetical protein
VIYIIKVCANLMVTVLIVVRMWNLSPHNRREIMGANLPAGTGWAAIVIVIESGVLYLTAQIVPLVLYIIRHPAVGLVSQMSVQIYVRTICHLNERKPFCGPNHTGHRIDTGFHSHGLLVTSAIEMGP